MIVHPYEQTSEEEFRRGRRGVVVVVVEPSSDDLFEESEGREDGEGEGIDVLREGGNVGRGRLLLGTRRHRGRRGELRLKTNDGLA